MNEVNERGLESVRALADDQAVNDSTRLVAAQAMLFYSDEQDAPCVPQQEVQAWTDPARWWDVGVKDLTTFFLKCAVATVPASLLMVLIYVSFLTVNFTVTQFMGMLI